MLPEGPAAFYLFALTVVVWEKLQALDSSFGFARGSLFAGPFPVA
jgi:hypothetical protein